MSKPIHYVALLRGINVGGKNKIKMTELKDCLSQHGLEDVATYIQSGNVLFASSRTDQEKLTAEIEAALVKAFDFYEAKVMLYSHDQIKQVIKEAPKGFGQPGYRYDVIFTKMPLTPAAALQDISLKEGVDSASAGTYAIYFARLEARVTSSRVGRIVMMPMYQSMTIRNWNTATKLLALLDARAAAS